MLCNKEMGLEGKHSSFQEFQLSEHPEFKKTRDQSGIIT